MSIRQDHPYPDSVTTPTAPRRIPASTLILATLLVLAILLAVAFGLGWIKLGNQPADAQPAVSAADAKVDLRAELSTFIAKRAAEQGKEAGAILLDSAMKAVERNGTEWVVIAEFDPLLIAAEAPKQLAYLVGKYDPAATKVTVRTPGGQELFAGKPPAEPISTES